MPMSLPSVHQTLDSRSLDPSSVIYMHMNREIVIWNSKRPQLLGKEPNSMLLTETFLLFVSILDHQKNLCLRTKSIAIKGFL
jgi:hypothetical protein